MIFRIRAAKIEPAFLTKRNDQSVRRRLGVQGTQLQVSPAKFRTILYIFVKFAHLEKSLGSLPSRSRADIIRLYSVL